MDLLHSFGQGRVFIAGAGLMGLLALGAMLAALRFFWPQSSLPLSQYLARPISEETRFDEARRRMVQFQLRNRDINDPRVLEVMGRIPRHLFVPEDGRNAAYEDHALPIEENQTISQPYIVALMTQTVRPTPQSRVLEIGVGSGYQAAVLAELCQEVYSVEIIKSLADNARERLAAMGYTNVSVRYGDGFQGWPEQAPFDAILVTAAPEYVPEKLEEQLAVGGRMVIPVGGAYYQELLLIEKQQDGTLRRESLIPVRFVPMTGEVERRSAEEK